LADRKFEALKEAQQQAPDRFLELAAKFWDAAAAAERKTEHRAKLMDHMAAKAEEGDAYTCQSLGALHYEGRQVERSYEKAASYFRKGAEAGGQEAAAHVTRLESIG
jgi:TPR repeat protein